MANPHLENASPVVPLISAKIDAVELVRNERPQKTFFYRRLLEDDDAFADVNASIFACHEEEAAQLDLRRFKQVGVSDGTTYRKHLAEHVPRGAEIPIENIRQALKDAFNAELEVARGHFLRPKRKLRFIGGVSSDVQNAEESLRSYL